MARMSGNDECTTGNFDGSLQLTTWNLYSEATCHMSPEVSDFIQCLLEDIDNLIEVADGHHVTAKQKLQVRIKMCDNNGDPFIATLHKIILEPDLCDRLFSIIMLLNLLHTCLFHKGFYTVYFGVKDKNAVTLPHSAQRNIRFCGKSRKCQRQRNYQLGIKLL